MRCVFCNINDIVLENDLALAFYDKYPVNKGHLLIIPKRHVEQYFDLTVQERSAIDQLLFEGKKMHGRTILTRWIQYRHQLWGSSRTNDLSCSCTFNS